METRHAEYDRPQQVTSIGAAPWHRQIA